MISKILRTTLVLNADMSKEKYEVFLNEVSEKNKLLAESVKSFNGKIKGKRYLHCIDFQKLDLKLQKEYTDIPFRNPEYDSKSTVASSGCAIIIAKFIETVFDCIPKFSVEELAQLAVMKGYRGYKKQEDGTYIPTGCKHVFFDRFIPSLYDDLHVERASSIDQIFESLWEYKLPVLLVSNNIYKCDPKNIDSHFVVLLGYEEGKGVTLFDPEQSNYYRKPFEEVIPALRVGWIVDFCDD